MDLEEFLKLYLNITNKNNIIEINLLKKNSENISDINFNKDEIKDFIASIKQKYLKRNYKENSYSFINYRYDNINIEVCNNKEICNKTIFNDAVNILYKNKYLNMCYKKVYFTNNLVSINKYMSIENKENIIFNLKLVDVLISYNSDEDYGTISILIKKPSENSQIIDLVNNIIDY